MSKAVLVRMVGTIVAVMVPAIVVAQSVAEFGANEVLSAEKMNQLREVAVTALERADQAQQAAAEALALAQQVSGPAMSSSLDIEILQDRIDRLENEMRDGDSAIEASQRELENALSEDIDALDDRLSSQIRALQ